ncbi:hypothetical protein JGS6364_PCS1200521 (plasmid) [[Clostridium] sordellii]|uniref:hypothetical protein n=1 Tax=Paraclostridium sordellii TaxID=1505 RepID=UPI0005408AA0|nr:hypothetical protein [Paeniclostridium sordellii]CEK32661.1 hypothetical protein JGS6364_PCS1200521 (plasmid) [[Clostridium] sordellii] [Paeniclostridium sordellii]
MMEKNKVELLKEGYQPIKKVKSNIGEFGYQPIKKNTPKDNGNRNLPKGDFGISSSTTNK